MLIFIAIIIRLDELILIELILLSVTFKAMHMPNTESRFCINFISFYRFSD